MGIEVVSYNKRIKGIEILSNINMTFTKGQIYGLQGKNGSGKTMLLRAISGLIFPTSGHVSINDQIIGKDIAFPSSLGLLIENPSFIDKYTGIKNLSMLASIKNTIDIKDIEQAIQKVGLDPQDKRPYKKYSLGMKQRLAIACAVMERPEIILLDEPINALDPSGVECVKKVLQEEQARGALIIIACHDHAELQQLANTIITLAEGKIVKREEVSR